MSTPGDVCFWFGFRPSPYHRAYVEYHTPYGGAPQNSVELQNVLHRLTDTIHPQHAPVLCIETSMEATAALHQSGPNDSAACSRAWSGDDVVFSGFSLLTLPVMILTGTTSATAPPAVSQAATTGAGSSSNFVADHGTCRVPLYRYLENKPACSSAMVYQVLFWSVGLETDVSCFMSMAAVIFLAEPEHLTCNAREFSHYRIPTVAVTRSYGS